jgi:hypothetical protein
MPKAAAHQRARLSQEMRGLGRPRANEARGLGRPRANEARGLGRPRANETGPPA